MNVEQEYQASQILIDAKARQKPLLIPRVPLSPSWFVGNELDLLDRPDRDRLYLEIASKYQVAKWVPFAALTANVPNIVNGVRHGLGWIWSAAALGLFLLVGGAWIYRRRQILKAARLAVRARGGLATTQPSTPLMGTGTSGQEQPVASDGFGVVFSVKGIREFANSGSDLA
jgi:hypothetical protein